MASVNIENAQIKTASVEIKSLTVSGKQVTLSLFRQIPEEELIEGKGLRLNGIPWGRINYFWKMKYHESDYIHIVWQKGRELRRSIVLDKVSTSNEYCTYNYKNMDVSLQEKASLLKKINDTGYFYSKHVCLSDVNNCLNIPSLMTFIENRSHPNYANEIQTATNRITFLKTLEQKLENEIPDLEIIKYDYSCKYKRLLGSLQELPQLFIAV